MTEYTWPNGVGDPTPEDIRRAWPATVTALPVGAAVTGKVIGRQPFGVFVEIDGVPDAVGLAEIFGSPPGTVPPPLIANPSGVRYQWERGRSRGAQLPSQAQTR
jgi:hypothetical protein